MAESMVAAFMRRQEMPVAGLQDSVLGSTTIRGRPLKSIMEVACSEKSGKRRVEMAR